MRKLAKAVLSALFFLVTLFISNHSHVYAEGEFETDYEVTYFVDANGTTNVNQEIILKNKTANFYADKFELKIGSTKINNVKAQDQNGPLEAIVKFENNVTSIGVTFNQRVIGIGKTLPWTLSYSSEELATQSGQIWEISIPKVSESADIGKYEAIVNVPSSFGKIAFTVPRPTETSANRQTQIFKFDKEELTKSGIAMSFGEKQIFSFDLNYYLENNNLTSQTQEITIPPDNNYQKIVIESFSKKPINIRVDEDGNYLAQYRLSPKQALDINITGFVEVFSKPIRNLGKDLTEEQKVIYTRPQKYWETDNAFIKDKAGELKNAKEIYDFVSTFLSYSNDRLQSEKVVRLGATEAIVNPENSVCMEFTDLFIALSRSAGIPSREVEGYAHTQNERLRPLSLALTQGDVLHAWPEYWDESQGWVQIDPTWGSTSGGLDYFNKLDFNHITFIQRGTSSGKPNPAGAYKRKNQTDKKSVLIDFAEELPQPVTAINLSLNIPEKIIAGIPVRVETVAQNTGSATILGRVFSLTTDLNITFANQTEVELLPPFSKTIATYSLQTSNLLEGGKRQITVNFGDESVTKTVEIVPFYYLAFSKGFVVSLILTILITLSGFYLYKKFPTTKKGETSK